MNSINPVEISENIKKKYLSFILTTICRENKVLCNELKEIFDNDKLLWTDLILQSAPKYKQLDNDIYSDLNFLEKLKTYISNNFPTPYVHQVSAWNKILNKKNCVVATGTGSGKTESFMFPIINHCLNEKNSGVQSIIIYPLKALANDQGKRFGKHIDRINEIFNTKITWAIFDGDTGKRVRKIPYKSELTEKEDILSNPPNILITNYVMLERILLNPEYLNILNNSKIKFLVLDEIHYYRGAQGIDVSLLIRRLQFYLSSIQNIETINYIGTSATLGSPKSQTVFSFLKKLFNTSFSEDNLVIPVFDESFKKGILFEPKFYNDIKDKIDLSKEENKDLKAHIFFKSPPQVYRCLECRKLYSIGIEKCNKCNSNFVFPIFTCRQCGEEYYNYSFINKSESDLKINDLDIIGFINQFKNDKDVNEKNIKDLIFSLKEKENSIKVRLCLNCNSINHNKNEKCTNCNNEELLDVFVIDHPENSINLNECVNDQYCPSCGFDSRTLPIIVSTSKLSDENCSHIVFQEYFLSLPPLNRKLLVFTDNVQRTSKFAREIEETLIKNIARAELHKIIEKLEEPISLSEIIFKIINKIKIDQTLINDVELNIKKELYEEVFSNGIKVGSLANRDLFKLSIFGIDSFNNEDKENILKIFQVFKKNNQILSYYQIVNSEEIFSYNQFFEKKELFTKIYRILNNYEGKKLPKDTDFSEVNNLIDLLNEKGYLDEIENKYFFKELKICIEKGKTIQSQDNYYDNWRLISKISFIKTEIDTGKTDPEKRSKLESDFKENKGNVNFLVSTSTLELGIDIGDLDVVGLLYAPPSPAQYIQRIGRAGRKGNSSLSLTFLSKRALDSIYFHSPFNLVKGLINPPTFCINLETPLKKSLFGLFLYFILNKTEFITEQRTKNLMNVKYWECNFRDIKNDWKKYENNFKEYVKKYIEISNLNLSFDNLIEFWINKLEIFIKSRKGLKSDYFSGKDIFNYFQQAGLLPDYAFGGGGPLVLRKNSDSISGFELRDVCPPSTLDYQKLRYTCEKINTDEFRQRLLTENYNQCSKCKTILSFNNEIKCNLCSSEMNIVNLKLIEPKIIYSKKSTFSLKPKRINWGYYIIDLPSEIEYELIVSKPFECNVGMIFESVSEAGVKKDYFLCEKCGKIYSKEDNKCFEGKHKKSNSRIASDFKTMGIILNYNEEILKNAPTFKNAIIAATTILAGCEDGEIGAILPAKSLKLILFDTVEGGVGFVSILNEKLKEVLIQAKELCEQDCCEHGCPSCIASFWRQNEIKFLNKRAIITQLEELIERL